MRHDVNVSFSALFNSASLGMIVANEQGEIVLDNPFLLQEFCYQESELVGEAVDKLIPSRFHNRHREHVAQYSKHPKKRPMGLDLFEVKKDEGDFPVEVSLGKIEEGKYKFATVNLIWKKVFKA